MKEVLNINHILDNIIKTVASHEVAPGQYSRWLWDDPEGKQDRTFGSNAYGCADAVNILYTLNALPRNREARELLIRGIQSHQEEKSGVFNEGTHVLTHTSAHCTAALELLDALPLYPFHDFEKYTTIKGMTEYLESHNWAVASGGHRSPAVYSMFAITRKVGQEWYDNYFKWLDENCDPGTGLWLKGLYPIKNGSSICMHMGNAFHILFTYEHAKMRYPYPDKLIDTCLDMCTKHEGYPNFGREFHFIEVDWVFCLNRSSRQTKHRFEEVQEALYSFAVEYIDWLKNVDWEHDDGANDMHMLFGTLCCLAELQLALPGYIHSDVPLRMVLDRRPFI